MQEVYEFRIPEERAAGVLPPDAGVMLGGGDVRKVIAQPGTPLYETIGRAQRQARAEGRFFHSSWQVRRRYTEAELAAASLFLLRPTAFTDQAGTPADGSLDAGGMVLDTRKLPKKDVVATLSGECVVSQRAAELIVSRGFTGVELRPVRHGEHKNDVSFEPSKVPAGRKLLEQAAAAGFPHPEWSFWVWLNKPEQRELLYTAVRQYWELTRPGRRRRGKQAPAWYQLAVSSKPVRTALPTRFGIGPFEDDDEGIHCDRAAGVAGLNVLSEVYVAEEEWDGSDFMETAEKVGIRMGLRRPSPLLLVATIGCSSVVPRTPHTRETSTCDFSGSAPCNS